MSFRADARSAEPPFQQLRAFVLAGIRSGALVPGERLPTVRALATASGLAANTIASAYRALDADGIIEGRGRAGTFITLGAQGDEVARAAAQEYVARIAGLGLDVTRAEELVREAFRARHEG
ncbi:GntR family transcriptional regulator [Leucobacter luti]|nr:GntR family transcriptional regulator [Leucobacter luti]